jgi:Uri superfamily endonuclease
MKSNQAASSTRARSSATPVEVFEASPGSYVLLLSSTSTELIQIGHLGERQLQVGYYVYIGSALGPGGLRSRLHHHLRPTDRPHWHIDYLKRHTMVERVWFCYGRRRREHLWAERIAALPGAWMPMSGFGSSDCDCQSHLFFFKQPPRLTCLKDVHIAEIASVRLHQSRNSH